MTDCISANAAKIITLGVFFVCFFVSLGAQSHHRRAESRYMKSAELIKMMEANGWELNRVKGSHHMFKHPTLPGTIAVPHPKKDLPIGTVKSILKSAGLK